MGHITEILSMFFLSLWKVYIGFSYFAYQSYPFIAAFIIIILAVIISNLLSLFVYKQMRNKSWFLKFTDSKNYHKGVSFYNKYGFYPSILLAPVLLGIPTISLLSLTLNISNRKVLMGLILSSLLWGVIINVIFYYSIELF